MKPRTAFAASLLTLLPSACQNTGPTPPSPAELAAETSVKPGINESWKSEDIGPLISRLEPESREIFLHRGLIASVVGPKPGGAIADVGAGSGFMAHLFSKQVGPSGKVYAVDINASLLEHIDVAHHGDDFLADGEPDSLDWMDGVMDSNFKLSKMLRVGPGAKTEGKILKRMFRAKTAYLTQLSPFAMVRADQKVQCIV